MTTPSYLRIVATTACNYACPFCHMEGDPQKAGAKRGLTPELLVRCLRVASQAGIHKFKFLGGEPLLRPDLPTLISGLRQDAPLADVSIISAGVIRPERLDRAFEAGLDRINVSIHGFSLDAFAHHYRNSRKGHALRARFLARVLEHGRPLKLNYVYGGEQCMEDLNMLLDWAAPRGILVNVLDDLGQDLSWRAVAAAIESLRGRPVREEVCGDAHSLDTLHWYFRDGLRVELKHKRLGEVAPFKACESCPVRSRCKEGIRALRLTHTGHLQPCMDREDLSLPLSEIIFSEGEEAGLAAWRLFVEAL